MRKILQFIMVLAIAMGHIACEGDEGPPGPAGAAGPQGPAGPTGPQGEPGESSTARVLNFVVNFQPDNDGNYFSGIEFAQNEDIDLTIADSDVVLVYALAGVNDDDPENPIPFWSPLPQTYTVEGGGTATYNYAFSNQVLLLFIDSELNLADHNELTQEQIFRLVVVPGELLNGRKSGPSVDLKNYDAVIKHYNIDDSNVREIRIN